MNPSHALNTLFPTVRASDFLTLHILDKRENIFKPFFVEDLRIFMCVYVCGPQAKDHVLSKYATSLLVFFLAREREKRVERRAYHAGARASSF